MSNYYRSSNPSDIRELPQSLIDSWIATSNPKLNEWIPVPSKPSSEAVWSNGSWTIPPEPVYTAEQWLEKEGYSGNRPTVLLYQKMRLDATNQTSPKLSAVQSWLESMIAAATAPATSDWPSAPHTFEETLHETLAVLAN